MGTEIRAVVTSMESAGGCLVEVLEVLSGDVTEVGAVEHVRFAQGATPVPIGCDAAEAERLLGALLIGTEVELHQVERDREGRLVADVLVVQLPRRGPERG